ncbi:hypothetical protein [Aquimarina litoralis]|uniref:hypothetical protein n=1 Tax=Aquimarina litoralis TaxID=584605 RepID=UPI001C58475D|nr:hypothetical protein [Aquimarina litoralis]MBW1297305.1 hypothetical protein [Aquimarina litoralis]
MKYDTLILEQKVKIKEDEIKDFNADMDVQKVLKKELLRSLQNAVAQENMTSVKKSLYALITQFRCQVYKNVG